MAKPGVVMVLACLVALAAACGSDKKQPATPTATPETPAPAVSATSAPTATAAVETIAGLPVTPLKLLAPAPPPNDIALYIESGCTACDGPAAALQRIYRAPDGAVRTDDLFRLPGATIRNPEVGPKYIMSMAVDQRAGDILVSVCEGPYCGGVGNQSPGAKTSIRHSTDGGITWKTEATLDGGVSIIANAGPSNAGPGGNVLIVRSYFLPDGAFRWEYAYYPSLATEPIDLRGIPAGSARIVVPVSGRPLLVDQDGVRLYFLDRVLPSGALYDFSRLRPRFTVSDFRRFTESRGGVVTFSDGTRAYSAVVETPGDPAEVVFNKVFAWPGEGPLNYRPNGSLLDERRWIVSYSDRDGLLPAAMPAIVDLEAGTITPIADFVTRAADYDRLLVHAATTGPFARVRGVGPGDCLNVRHGPSAAAPVAACYPDGVLMKDIGERRDADGLRWALLATPDGQQGWASTAFLEMRGASPSLGYHPHGTRTGDAAIDAVIAALEQSSQLPQALVRWQKEACKTPPIQGLGGPPECPGGVAEGTLLDVIPGASCEGTWHVREGDAPVQLVVGPEAFLYAVVRPPASLYPGGELSLIYVSPSFPEAAKLVFMSGGRVVGDNGGCGRQAAQLVRDAVAVVFPPP